MPLYFAVRGIMPLGSALLPNLIPDKTEAFDHANWTKGPSAQTTADAATSPTGTTTAEEAHATLNDGDTAYVQRQISGVGAGTYTWSVHVKSNDALAQWVRLSLHDGSHHRMWFDVINGVTGTQDAGVTGNIVSSTNGYYRAYMTYTKGATDPFVHLGLSDGDNSLVGAINKQYFIWGAQLVSGSVPGTYNPNL
jgi:hypothetical protein